MKQLFRHVLPRIAVVTAVVAAFAASASALAPTPTPTPKPPARRVVLVVLEFNTGPNATGIGAEGTQTLQNGIVASAVNRGGQSKYVVSSVATSSAAVQNELLTLNGPGTAAQGELLRLSGTGIPTASAVKIGKLLGVNYVMTGSVTEYGTTDKGAHMTINADIVNVATGMVVWSSAVRHSQKHGVTKIGAGTLEMTEKVMKPCIQKLTANLKAADL